MSDMAITQRSFQDISIESEARRLCDERGLTDIDDLRRMCAYLRHQEFTRAIEPYLKIKCSFAFMPRLDKIVMNADGTVARVDYHPLPPEAQAVLDQIEEAIQAEAVRWSRSPS